MSFTNNTEETEFCGNICEKGFLDNLFRKGFTPVKCISELHANSLDAITSHILYEVNRDIIKIKDFGKGMNKNDINNMFSMYRANHNNDKSLGVSGFGAKAALAILSKKQQVIIFTYKEGGEYLCVHVPWDKIFQTGKYTGMIETRKMTNIEIESFKNERVAYGKTTGTTICFIYNSDLEKAIKVNFDTEYLSSILPQDRLSINYGKFHNTKVEYKHFENISDVPIILSNYDYFKSANNDFYTGKRTDVIAVYKKNDSSSIPALSIASFFTIKKAPEIQPTCWVPIALSKLGLVTCAPEPIFLRIEPQIGIFNK